MHSDHISPATDEVIEWAFLLQRTLLANGTGRRFSAVALTSVVGP